MKKMFIVHPDGTYTTACEDPRYTDMVVYHTDAGNLKIEAPCNGNFSTAAQRKTVNELAGKWLDSKVSKIGISASGEITVREDKSNDDGIEIRFITASTDGKLSQDEAVAGAGLIGEWVGKTAKKDTAKKAAPAAPAATANDDDKKTPPPAEPDKKSDPAPDDGDTPPAGPDKKSDPAPVAPDKKSDPAPDPAPTKSTPAPAKKDGVHWDPNLSVDENIERLWNA